MTETRDTKCPLCGAPVAVRISDDPFFVGSDCTPTRIAYEYDRPKPHTIQGYEIRDLQAVATLLRQDLITPEDLHAIKNNFERAFVMVAEIQRRDMERQFAAFRERCLDPAAFAGVKLNLDPLKITQEQFGAIFKDKEEGQA